LEDEQQSGTLVIAAGEFVLGEVRERWNNGPNIPAVAPWMRDGSFHVFRRLEQDVAAWRAAMERLAPPELSADTLAAKAVGREPDGKPLISGASGDNDFDYDDDPEGHEVPRWAHCRKVNPRNADTFNDRHHRIVRRAVPFGPAYDSDANQARGLLFNAFMASIDHQFEFLQHSWAGDPKFPAVPLDTTDTALATDDGVDPIASAGAHPCRLRVPGHVDRQLDFGRFVHVRGAAYAFAPSIPTLRMLATT
jgi:Dyp-type peroxidase family